MHQANLYPLQEAAKNLGISESLIEKFIKKGLVIPIRDKKARKLTPYGLRQLRRVINLYEQSYSLDLIERLINNGS